MKRQDPIALAHKIISGDVKYKTRELKALIERLNKISGQPVKSDGRSCFGIDWYAKEAQAEVASLVIKLRGDTYNGGWFHGMPCGRDSTFDHKDKETGVQYYAVTTR